MIFDLAMPAVLAATVAVETTPYKVDPVADGVATGAMLGLMAVMAGAVKPAFSRAPACGPFDNVSGCDESDLNPLDRAIVGSDSAAWRQVSDIGQTAALVLPVAATAVDVALSDSPTPLRDGVYDGLVMAEGMAAANLLTHVLKFAIRRPRPTQYSGSPGASTFEHKLSFPSGHATAAASAAAAYTTTFTLRHPESPWRWVVLGSGVALTTAVGIGRIEGGMHFPTDVLAGALVGGSIGFLVPWLHRSDVMVSAAPTVDSRGQLVQGMALTKRF